MASSDDSSPDLANSSKRKRTPEGPQPSKRSQKRKRTKARHTEEDIDVDSGINLALGRMNPDLLADYVAKRAKRFEGEITLVELENRRIPVSAFVDTTQWDRVRSLDQLPDFLEHFSRQGAAKTLREAPKQHGSPHTIVITAAGLRAADIARVLRKYQSKGCMVAKLFAKHIKLTESIHLLKKTRVNIGVGTPARLIDLLEAGALKVDKLERLVVDVSHVDQKQRGILDMRETQKPLMDLLNRDELKPRYGSEDKKLQLLFF